MLDKGIVWTSQEFQVGVFFLHSPRQESLVELEGQKEKRCGLQTIESLVQGNGVPFPSGWKSWLMTSVMALNVLLVWTCLKLTINSEWWPDMDAWLSERLEVDSSDSRCYLEESLLRLLCFKCTCKSCLKRTYLLVEWKYKTLEDHLALLDKVLTKLWEAGLKIGKDKFTFAHDSAEFLGYKISAQGICIIHDRI